MEGRELVAFSAALIAALLSIAKLIADKETRISDFRKDWINSFRQALSEMLGEAHAISGRIKIRIKHAELAKQHASTSVALVSAASAVSVKVGEHGDATEEQARVVAAPNTELDLPAAATKGTAPLSPTDATSHEVDPLLLTAAEVAELESDLTSHWNTLRKAHRTVLLHLNFSETAWGTFPYGQNVTPSAKAQHVWDLLLRSSKLTNGLAVTSAYDPAQNGRPSEAAALLVAQLDQLVTQLLGRYYEVGAETRYDTIKRSIDNSTLLGNLVLKPEWNRIKRGEDRYNQLLYVLGTVVLFGGLALAIITFSPRKPIASTPADQATSDVTGQARTTNATCSLPASPRVTTARGPYVPGHLYQACRSKSPPE